MPGVDFERVRSTISMSQVLRLIGFTAGRTHGDQLRGPCPVHESISARSRAFSANLVRQRYRCFRCGSSGNQLELWAAVTRQGLHAAAVDLCMRLGVEVPWIRRW